MLAFIFVLAVLIFVHELGHFLAAKAVGIGVPRFSIGFGPATPLRFRRGETEYVVAWLPLGGYVKMASKEEQEAIEALEGGKPEQEFPPEKLFESKSVPARILVISAGVIMNVLLAWGIYAGILAAYGRALDPTTTVARVDAEVLPEAAAELGELPYGTEILRVNGEEVTSWDAIVGGILEPTTDEVRFEFAGGVEPVVVAVPGIDPRTRSEIARALLPLWEARVGEVSAGLPAAAAGLERGDLIVAIDGEPIRSWVDLVDRVEVSAGREMVFEIERRGERFEVILEPAEVSVEDPLSGEVRKVGRIGIGPLIEPRRVTYGPVAALLAGAERVWDDGMLVLTTLKGMVLGRISPRELGGPIFIGQASAQFARVGFVALLSFMALLSVNLAILNLLPIPVLDGGHLVFLVLEGVRGKPLSQEIRHRLTSFGLYFLLAVMVLAILNDVLRWLA